jgi:hypothetical protein
MNKNPFEQLETSGEDLVRFEASIELPKPSDNHGGHSVVLEVYGPSNDINGDASITVYYEDNGEWSQLVAGKISGENFRTITGYVPPPAPLQSAEEALRVLLEDHKRMFAEAHPHSTIAWEECVEVQQALAAINKETNQKGTK